MALRFRLVTRRTVLRSWRLSDVGPYHRACNRKSVMRWLGGVQSSAELLSDVAYFMASEIQHGVTFWVVERRSDGAFLGFCGLVRIPDCDCPFKGKLEIGWRLRQSAWRRGFGFETAAAVLNHAFSKLEVGEVVSRTADGNRASRALMRKLGMRRNPEMDYRPRCARRKLIAFGISAAQWRSRDSGSLA